MAAKNARSGSKRNVAGTGNPGTGNDDDADIQRLIDGDGSGEADGESSTVGDASSGSEREGGDSGSESERGGEDGRQRERDSEYGSRDSRASSRTRAGNRGRRASSRSAGRGASSASEETRDSQDDIFGSVKTPKKPKVELETDDIPSTSAEIISDSFQFVFWGIGQATGLDEWQLDDDDARDIGRNGDKWLKSLGKKRASNILKGLNKIGPSLAFFGSIGMAIVPRVRVTIQHGKNGTIRPIQTRKASNANGNPSQSVASGSAGTTQNPDSDSSTGERAIPFRPEDFGEVTQGFAGQDDGLPVS